MKTTIKKALAKYKSYYKSLLLLERGDERTRAYHKVDGMELILDSICPEELLNAQKEVNLIVEEIIKKRNEKIAN